MAYDSAWVSHQLMLCSRNIRKNVKNLSVTSEGGISDLTKMLLAQPVKQEVQPKMAIKPLDRTLTPGPGGSQCSNAANDVINRQFPEILLSVSHRRYCILERHHEGVTGGFVLISKEELSILKQCVDLHVPPAMSAARISPQPRISASVARPKISNAVPRRPSGDGSLVTILPISSTRTAIPG